MSAISSRCAALVSMLFHHLPVQPMHMGMGQLALQFAELALLLQKLARTVGVAGDEHRQAQPQVGAELGMQLAEFLQPAVGEGTALGGLEVLPPCSPCAR